MGANSRFFPYDFSVVAGGSEQSASISGTDFAVVDVSDPTVNVFAVFESGGAVVGRFPLVKGASGSTPKAYDRVSLITDSVLAVDVTLMLGAGEFQLPQTGQVEVTNFPVDDGGSATRIISPADELALYRADPAFSVIDVNVRQGLGGGWYYINDEASAMTTAKPANAVFMSLSVTVDANGQNFRCVEMAGDGAQNAAYWTDNGGVSEIYLSHLDGWINPGFTRVSSATLNITGVIVRPV